MPSRMKGEDERLLLRSDGEGLLVRSEIEETDKPLVVQRPINDCHLSLFAYITAGLINRPVKFIFLLFSFS